MLPEQESEFALPEDVPVGMPELPATLRVHTAQQFKAIGEQTRLHILDIIKYEPLTAKQLSERLGLAPGTVGHHLQVLEEAGLAQIVARRLIHGIVAKYYTRTARLFLFDFPHEVAPEAEYTLGFLTQAQAELADALRQVYSSDEEVEQLCKTAFPHARLSPARAREFRKRLDDLIYEFATDPPDPDGQIYGFCSAFFQAPPYLQVPIAAAENEDA